VSPAHSGSYGHGRARASKRDAALSPGATTISFSHAGALYFRGHAEEESSGLFHFGFYERPLPLRIVQSYGISTPIRRTRSPCCVRPARGHAGALIMPPCG
jgi:hypothetical protein